MKFEKMCKFELLFHCENCDNKIEMKQDYCNIRGVYYTVPICDCAKK